MVSGKGTAEGAKATSFETSTVGGSITDSEYEFWSWREELNLQPVVYKTTALPLSYASPLYFFNDLRYVGLRF